MDVDWGFTNHVEDYIVYQYRYSLTPNEQHRAVTRRLFIKAVVDAIRKYHNSKEL